MDPTPPSPAPTLFDLSGRVALITGASRGIGAACAIALAQAGASVCLVYRTPASASSPILHTLNTIRASGATAEAVFCDLDDLDAVKHLFQKAIDVMGGHIHILVNCAGIQRRSPSLNFAEEDWDSVLNVNLKSVWLLSQTAGRHMVPLRRGKIINFCSLLTFQGGLTVPAYAAAKGALGQLTKALSNEWSQHNTFRFLGVRKQSGGGPLHFMGLSLPLIDSGVRGLLHRTLDILTCSIYFTTPMVLLVPCINYLFNRNEKLLQDPVRYRQISDRIPAGRWGDPKDFAGPVVFLASTASQYVCGELVVVDGGWMGR